MKEITINPKLVNFEATNDGAFVADVELAPAWVIHNVVYASFQGQEPKVFFFTQGKPLFKVNCGDPKRMTRPPVRYPKWLRVMISELFVQEIPKMEAKRAEKLLRREGRRNALASSGGRPSDTSPASGCQVSLEGSDEV